MSKNDNLKETNKESKSFDNISQETEPPAVDKSNPEDDKIDLDHYSRKPNPDRSFRQLADQGRSRMNESELGERVAAVPPDMSKLRENYKRNTGHQAWINSDQSEDNKRKSNIRRNLEQEHEKNIDENKISEQITNHHKYDDVEPQNISYHLR